MVELTATYDSAASTDFKPYIVDPSTTTDLVDRILYKRSVLRFLLFCMLVYFSNLHVENYIFKKNILCAKIKIFLVVGGVGVYGI